MIKCHYLKILPEYYVGVINKTKLAELRLNDRNFKVGDKLMLCEFSKDIDDFTGNRVIVDVIDVCHVDFIAKGYVLISIKNPVEMAV